MAIPAAAATSAPMHEADVRDRVARRQLERQSARDHAPPEPRARLGTRPDRVDGELCDDQDPRTHQNDCVVGDAERAAEPAGGRRSRGSGERCRSKQPGCGGQAQPLAKRDHDVHRLGIIRRGQASSPTGTSARIASRS